MIDASYPGVKRLLFFAYDGRINVNNRVRVDSHTKSWFSFSFSPKSKYRKLQHWN